MEIGKQIKKHRSEMEVSQEELAERIFVSRQTISNWENDKNYPDLKSLALLSSLFGVSLDTLVKGDIEQMKEEIKNEIKAEDIKHFKRTLATFQVLFFGVIIAAAISIILFFTIYSIFPRTTRIGKYIVIGGAVISILIDAGMFFSLCRFEKLKKKFDLQTYKEIVAFSEGKTLDEIDKHRDREEWSRQKSVVLAYFVQGIFVGIMFALAIWLWYNAFPYIISVVSFK